jgi:ClpP class serine protease
VPNWGGILQQIQEAQAKEIALVNQANQESARRQFLSQPVHCINVVKRTHLLNLQKKTGRNIIAYYSGFLSKPNVRGIEINDEDKNGFMAAVHGLPRSQGLDLIIHTPGGGITATQSIVDYLHKMYRINRNHAPDIRAIVPQIAMSAGTMIACSCKEILMGKQSNLGPIDPQVNGWPAYGVLKEFEKACKEVKDDPSRISVWQSILGQYRPTFLGHCKNAIDLSNAFVRKQLANVMFKGQPGAHKKADQIVKKLTHYARNKTHDRHLHFEECKEMGLNVGLMEEAKDSRGYRDTELQEAILSVHHCYMHLLMNTPVYKVIENHMGVGFYKAQSENPPTKPNQPQAIFLPT